MDFELDFHFQNSLELLKKLIRTPSISKTEDQTALIIQQYLLDQGVMEVFREHHNIWAFNQFYDPRKPTILLNSHHDTVKPNPEYSRDPFEPTIENGKLFGLGSNDAGASLVSLIAVFLIFYKERNLPYNFCLAATAEEEISGKQGIESIINKIGACDFAIVGEPTEMQPAIAEKGLLVLDCVAWGQAGHAAREEGINAIYKALVDIEWFKSFQFPEKSELLGPVKMSVTMINAGSQHNVVPAKCEFVVDIRSNDCYSNEEILQIIEQHVGCEIKPRSLRLNPSSISLDHPFVQVLLKFEKTPFGSPTMSDQALLKIPSLKMGPGHSSRSHMANEFVYVSEIENAIKEYTQLLAAFLAE